MNIKTNILRDEVKALRAQCKELITEVKELRAKCVSLEEKLSGLTDWDIIQANLNKANDELNEILNEK